MHISPGSVQVPGPVHDCSDEEVQTRAPMQMAPHGPRSVADGAVKVPGAVSVQPVVDAIAELSRQSQRGSQT